MAEARQLFICAESDPAPRRNVKKVMKLVQKFVKLTQKLNLREGFLPGMLSFYHYAALARRMNISCENDPEIYKQEAWKYAQMFGDEYIHFYNKSVNI